MTFLELCKATRQECGIQGTGPITTVDQTGLLKRIVDWVVAADVYIQRLRPDWDFLWEEHTVNTVEGASVLTAPSDVGAWDIESFSINKGLSTALPVTVITFREWRDSISEKTNSIPSSCCVKPNNDLAFLSPTNGIYSFYGNYWAIPTKMTSNTDEPLYSSEFDSLIIARAKMWFFEDSESIALYQAAEKEFKEVLITFESRYLINQDQLSLNSPMQMRVRSV